MEKYESFIELGREILGKCEFCVSRYDIPLEDFINAGIKGICQMFEDQMPIEDTTFADSLHSKISNMPIEMVRAMCLAPAYASASIGMFMDGMLEEAHHMLINANEEIGFLAGAGFGKMHEFDALRNQRKAIATKGADATNARHAKNLEAVHKWLDENYRPDEKIKDLAIALSKLVPREYETLLKDIPAWKKLRGMA